MSRARILALEAALDLDPADWADRLVLADLLDETHETSRAEGQRWQAENRARPHHYPPAGVDEAAGRGVLRRSFPWVWTSEGGLPDALPHARLPDEVREEIGFGEWRAYRTRRHAEDDVAAALCRLRDALPDRCRLCNATMVRCDSCGAEWCLDHQERPLVCPGCGARPSAGLPATAG